MAGIHIPINKNRSVGIIGKGMKMHVPINQCPPCTPRHTISTANGGSVTMSMQPQMMGKLNFGIQKKPTYIKVKL